MCTIITGRPLLQQQQRSSPRHAAKKRRQEAEGRRPVAVTFRYDLVQGSERQAALRQMRIESGEAEGKATRFGRETFQPRQLAA